MAPLTPEEAIEKARLLDNSVPFELTIWSDDPKLDFVVDRIFGILSIIHGFTARPKVRKKLLKIALLNLYDAFLTDPNLYVRYHRGSTYYSKIPARYNPNKVRRTLIDVIDALRDKGFVEHHKGHYSRTGGKSHISRMKANDLLINVLDKVISRKSILIEKSPTTECIILRDSDKKSKSQIDIDYEDTPKTIRMRRELTAYNNLLRRSFIDIPFFPEDGVSSSPDRRKIKINRSNKFVRRIFNNGVWDNGGRFYGGWWQSIPKEWRREIRFYTLPSIEIDYSGLHIILLYALEGIDYWRDIGDDPYSLPGLVHDDRIRRLLKMVLLIAINAKNKTSAIRAVTA
jgi:hypothetical protein